MLSTFQPWLRSLANRGLQRAISCRCASSQREFDAIAALRYSVHIREQNVPLDDADHERQRIWYPEDDLPGTLHFYAGSMEDMLGCLRIRVWRPGEVPEELREFYSMDRLPGVDGLTLCDVTKMVVIPRLRGTAAMAALSGHSLYETITRHKPAAMFACCAPGLLRSYRAIGLRTFGGRARHTAWGLTLPLVGITRDPEHCRRIGSPWYPPLRRLELEGRLPEDLPEIRELAVRDRSALTERAQVGPELNDFAQRQPSSFLAALSRQSLDALARYGMILDVPEGVYLTRLGVVEREVFVILDGEFGAWIDGREVRRMGSGQIFGEIGLLSGGGQRTAEVRAATAGRVLVLRRKFLPELSESRPRAALEIYKALTQELLRKLVENTATAAQKDGN